MGVFVQDLEERKGELVRLPNEAPLGTVVWVVVRRAERPNLPPGWWIQGIATDEQHAIAMCRSAEYFIGPFGVNVSLPEETVEWVGAYCPLAAH